MWLLVIYFNLTNLTVHILCNKLIRNLSINLSIVAYLIGYEKISIQYYNFSGNQINNYRLEMTEYNVPVW